MKANFSKVPFKAAAFAAAAFLFTAPVYSHDMSDGQTDHDNAAEEEKNPMNGYVAPFTNAQLHLSDHDRPGLRVGGGIEFARLYKWVALDLRAMTGQSYNDFGGAIKFSNYWLSDDAHHIFTLGAGVGMMVANRGDLDVPGRQYNDIFMTGFFTYIWDSQNEWGVMARFGVDTVLQRRYLGGKNDDNDRIPVSDSKVRWRPYITFGIPFGA